MVCNTRLQPLLEKQIRGRNRGLFFEGNMFSRIRCVITAQGLDPTGFAIKQEAYTLICTGNAHFVRPQLAQGQR